MILIGGLLLSGCNSLISSPAVSTECHDDSLKMVDIINKQNLQLESMARDWQAGKRYKDRAKMNEDESKLTQDKTKLQQDEADYNKDKNSLKTDEK